MYALSYNRYIYQWQGLLSSRPHGLSPQRPGDEGDGKGLNCDGYTMLYYTILYCNIRRNIYVVYELHMRCIAYVHVHVYKKVIIMMDVSIHYRFSSPAR